MTVFSSSRPTISLRALPRFPSNLAAGPGISLTFNGNEYKFNLDYEGLPEVSSISSPSQYVIATYNTVTGSQNRIRLDQVPVTPADTIRRAVGDASVDISASDGYIALNAILTAPRTWTLPPANTTAAGRRYRIQDEIAGVGFENTLTILARGTDRIDGAQSVVLNYAYAGLELISDGVGKYSYRVIKIDASDIVGGVIGPSRGGTGVSSLGAGVPNALQTSINSANGLALLGSNATLPVANGGTGLTSLTAGRIPFGNGTGALQSIQNLFYDAPNGRLGVGPYASSGISQTLHIADDAPKIRIGRDTSNAYIDIGRAGADGYAEYNAAQASPFRGHKWLLGGVEAMRIDSSGRIGIGTTTPSGQLSIDAGGGPASTVNSSGTGAFFLSYTPGTFGVTNRIMFGSSQTAGFGFASISGSYDSYTTGPGGSILFSTSNGAGTSGITERMRIDSSGQVGIGTTPSYKLDVSGSLRTTGATYLNSGAVANGLAIGGTTAYDFVDIFGSATLRGTLSVYSALIQFINGSSGAYTPFNFQNGQAQGSFAVNGYAFELRNSSTNAAAHMVFLTSNTERMRITSAGDVGIGTTNTGYGKFTVSDGTVFLVTQPFAASSVGYLGCGTNHALALITNNTERMRITTDGKVGIGISPSVPLDVNGQIRALDGTVDLRMLPISGSNGAIFGTLSNHALFVYTNNIERMRITTDGKVLIGTTTAGASKLTVADDSIQINTAKTPASATATGTTGQVCWDASYIYVCTATNTWKRAAIATW